MRFTTAQYLEKEVVTVSIRNANASAVMLDGQPVFLANYDIATNFGTDAQLYSETGAHAAFAAGIAKWNKSAGTSSSLASAAVGEVLEAVAYGFTDALVTLRTRAASTDTWASNAAIAIGDELIPETVGNNLSRQGTLAASNVGLSPFIAAQSVASQTTGASNGTHAVAATNGLVDYVRMKVFCRCM